MAEAVPYPLAFHSNIPRLTGGHIGDAGFPGALLGGHDARVEQGRRSLPLSSTRDGLVRYGPLVSPPGQALARYPMSVIDCCGRYARSSLSPPRFRWRKGQCFADRQTRAIDDDQLP